MILPSINKEKKQKCVKDGNSGNENSSIIKITMGKYT